MKCVIFYTLYPLDQKGVIVMAANTVTGDQYRRIDRKLREIKRQLDQQGGSPIDSQKLELILQAVIEGRPTFYSPECPLMRPHSLFRSAMLQHANIVRWNKQRGWDFSEDELEEAKLWDPEITLADADAEDFRTRDRFYGWRDHEYRWWPRQERSALVLTPYLENERVTFSELVAVIGSQYQRTERDDRIVIDTKHLRLLKGITHQQGLKWEWVNLRDNWDRVNGIAPATVRTPQTAVHAQGLAAAAHFHEWIEMKWQGIEPHIWLSGYELTLGENSRHPRTAEPWAFSPTIICGHAGSYIAVLAYPWDDAKSHNCAVATVQPVQHRQ